MSKSTKCFLRCISNQSSISLPHSEEVVLGRCLATGISEKRCSKKQLTFIADTYKGYVKVRQVGQNTSALNGIPIRKDVEKIAHHLDEVHFLLGDYKYRIEFDPPPLSSPSRQKRSLSPDTNTCIKRKEKRNKNDLVPNGNDFYSENTWESAKAGKLLIFSSKGLTHSSKIAAYDMDGTLIATKSGRVFAKDVNDWRILMPEVPVKLKKLHSDGFKIVILTNQAGISRGKLSVKDFQHKVGNIVMELGVPVQLFAATGESIYRKPAPGMWDLLLCERNGGIGVDCEKSFYCGDAAGRPENWAPKVKKDFSCSDRLFACNLGLAFFTPEEHFRGMKPAPFKLPDFDPAFEPGPDYPLLEPPSACLTSSRQEIIVMVGSPGSGKSFICRTHLIPVGYKHVNRDTLGSWQKCVSASKSALEDGVSVVVDNTNPDPEARARYTELAKILGVPCRCFCMDPTTARARHNNKFRELIGEAHEPISEMVMNSYKSKYKEPQLSEGFKEIVKVNFKPKFQNTEHERLYKMYLLDKY